MLSNEKPIHSREEDFLNRRHFADNISNAIINYDDKEKDSLTIGLYGKWGSGKTSIVNMITEKLDKEDHILIFNFEPWLFSDTEQLITNFFKEFAQVIKHNNTNQSQKLTSLGKKLEAYASLFEPLSFVPEPSIAVFGQVSSKVLSSMGKTTKNFGNAYKKNISEIKKDIEEHLGALNKKILIIVDDIDRLNNTEIKQIFQLIKALGNFPNTIYLASMDKDVIINALSEVQNGNGNEYLEKIINVPIEIPLLSKIELNKFLFKKLDEILLNIKKEDFDKNYWSAIYHSGYKNFFTNVRDILRYINILRFNNDSLKQKVNIIDLMVITAFQIFEPKVYNFLKHKKELFTKNSFESLLSQPEEIQNKIVKELLTIENDLNKIDTNSFNKLLKKLFPKIDTSNYNQNYRQLRKESRIATNEFYDSYFSLTLEEEISKEEIKRFIDTANDKNSFQFEFQVSIKKDNTRIYLERLIDFLIDDNIPHEYFQTMLDVFIDLGTKVSRNNQDGNVFNFSSNAFDNIKFIIRQILEKTTSKEEKISLLTNAIKNAKNDIYFSFYTIIIFLEEYNEHNFERNQIEPTFNYQELSSLVQLLKEKIVIWVKTNNLFQEDELYFILWNWKYIDTKKAHEYIKNNLKEKNDVIKFIKIFKNDTDTFIDNSLLKNIVNPLTKDFDTNELEILDYYLKTKES